MDHTTALDSQLYRERNPQPETVAAAPSTTTEVAAPPAFSPAALKATAQAKAAAEAAARAKEAAEAPAKRERAIEGHIAFERPILEEKAAEAAEAGKREVRRSVTDKHFSKQEYEQWQEAYERLAAQLVAEGFDATVTRETNVRPYINAERHEWYAETQVILRW